MVAFLLILMGIFIIFINIRAIKKEENSFKNTLNGSMDNIDEYKEEMGLIRIEFGETLVDIQKEMEYLKKELNILKENYDNNRVSDLTQSDEEENNKNIQIIHKEEYTHKKESGEGENSVKVSEVNKLLKKGYSVEKIAEQLHIGKGEVILIKELYSK